MRLRCVDFFDREIFHDRTCGIGADALALAREGARIVASDLDLRHAWMTRANLEHDGSTGARVLVADAERPALHAGVLLIDPDRRAQGRRDARPERWSPTLATTLALAEAARAACVKLPPGLDLAALGAAAERVDLQWVSHAGELAELCLWTGAARQRPGVREAVVLARDGGEHRLRGEEQAPADPAPLGAEEARRVAWIAEPDPAVIRSGLVGQLARELGLRPLGPRIAYLGGERPPVSPLVACWPVLDRCAADRRRVREMLRGHGIGPLTVKKRGHPETAEVLARRFRGPGERPGRLLVTRLERGHEAYLLGEQGPAGGR